MRVRRLFKIGLAAGSLAVAGFGCAAMQAASDGVSSTTGAVNGARSSVNDVKSTAQGTKADVDDTKGQVDALKKGGGGGGSGGGSAGGGGGGGKGGDPDGDERRSVAKEGKVNEPLTDNVDPGKGDNVDWKYFDLAGRPGRFTVELHWDDENALLNLDVYDALGAAIASAPGKDGAQAVRALAQIDQPGRVYVKISLNKKVGTDYTFIAKWNGPTGGGGGAVAAAAASVPPPVAASQVPNPAMGAGGGAPPPATGAPPAAAGAPADDPNHPRAKIVQNYREGSDLVLYLDKGSAVGIKAGMTGNILEGDDKLLDGGTLKVTKVVDATHSIAKTTVSKIGKTNLKCIINLVK